MNVSFSQTTPKVTQQGDFGQGLSIEHLCFLLQLTFFSLLVYFEAKATQTCK